METDGGLQRTEETHRRRSEKQSTPEAPFSFLPQNLTNNTLKKQESYVIVCDDENHLNLSNEHESETWNSIQKLLEILIRDSKFSSTQTLFDWKKTPRHVASAREVYAWRAAIEEIKNNDLVEECKGVPRNKVILLADKPMMLKMAGETTSALMHSYTRAHGITFRRSQSDSKVPS